MLPATHISRKRRNWETRRQSEACKRAEPEAKRKLMAPRVSHAAEQRLRSQATRTDENFPGIIHASHGDVNAGTLRLLKSQCDGTGESRFKARRKLERGLMANAQVTADARRAF